MSESKAAMPGERRRTREPLRYRLRSFRAESGFPYDQYVWVYSGLYRFAMRRLHAMGQHWFDHLHDGGGWCHWCGLRVGDRPDEGDR